MLSLQFEKIYTSWNVERNDILGVDNVTFSGMCDEKCEKPSPCCKLGIVKKPQFVSESDVYYYFARSQNLQASFNNLLRCNIFEALEFAQKQLQCLQIYKLPQNFNSTFLETVTYFQNHNLEDAKPQFFEFMRGAVECKTCLPIIADYFIRHSGELQFFTHDKNADWFIELKTMISQTTAQVNLLHEMMNAMLQDIMRDETMDD